MHQEQCPFPIRANLETSGGRTLRPIDWDCLTCASTTLTYSRFLLNDGLGVAGQPAALVVAAHGRFRSARSAPFP